MTDSKKEIVICAAVRWDDRIWRGHRHNNCLATMRDNLSYDMTRREMDTIKPEHGFMTSENRFVDRLEELAAGIKSNDPRVDGSYKAAQLYSEDVY